jgi:histidyl-tRNA synthetase
MALSTQPYKGARDFYPEDKRLQQYLFGVMRKVCEKYGYEEYDAPILEPTELYATKTSDEIINEQTYTFTDRGGRSVTLRTEMTPSVSRMVAAKRQELAYPLRWYSIPVNWRYERPQRGRLREFWQLNVDIFGIESTEAEQEIIQVADDIMKSYGAKKDMYTFRLNSRKLVNNYMTEVLHLNETQSVMMLRLIDRMQKIERPEFLGMVDAIFSPSQREAGASQLLLAFLDAKSIDGLPASLLNNPSVVALKELMSKLADLKITNIAFDPSLMRGFDYYTDIVFEVYDNDPENNRSMFGGGRYDGLIGLFGAEPLATVGFGMGDVTLANFLSTHDLLPKLRTETDLYIIPIGNVQEDAKRIAMNLREMEVNTAHDISGRSPDKQIKAAVKKGIRYVLFVGEKELANEQYVIKDLQSGTEETHSIERIASIVKDYRAK